MPNVIIVGFLPRIAIALRERIDQILMGLGKTGDGITSIASMDTKWCDRDEPAPYIIVRDSNAKEAEQIAEICIEQLNVDAECEVLHRFFPASRKGPVNLPGLVHEEVATAQVPVETVGNEDEQIIRLAIERMAKGKQRVINGLANDGITAFSQLKDKPYWRVDRRQYGLGKKTHIEFAKALVANGHECVYTQSCLRKSVPELEQERLVIRELTGRDWKKILRVPWNAEMSPSIKGIQRRHNKPVAIGKALPSEDRNHAPGHKMNSVNCMFRKAKLPYRLKIVTDVPLFGTIDDRKVQLAVLPK